MTTMLTQPAPLFSTAPAAQGEVASSVILTRAQVIDRIMSLNPTASPEFLEDFSERQLQVYLDHLVAAQMPRGRMARWVRPGDTPGIVMAESPD